MAVQLDAQLLEILACPCPEHGRLTAGTAADPNADFLTCAVCHRSYPVTDGIPVLLLDEAVQGAPDEGPTVG